MCLAAPPPPQISFFCTFNPYPCQANAITVDDLLFLMNHLGNIVRLKKMNPKTMAASLWSNADCIKRQIFPTFCRSQGVDKHMC
jgi:hypothetical protein